MGWGAGPPGPPPRPPARTWPWILGVVGVVAGLTVVLLLAVTSFGRDAPADRSARSEPSPTDPAGSAGTVPVLGDGRSPFPDETDLAQTLPGAGDGWLLEEYEAFPESLCAAYGPEVLETRYQLWDAEGPAEVHVRVDRYASPTDAASAVQARMADGFERCVRRTLASDHLVFDATPGGWAREYRGSGGSPEFVHLLLSGGRATECTLASALGWRQAGSRVVSARITTCAGPEAPGAVALDDLLELMAQRIDG